MAWEYLKCVGAYLFDLFDTFAKIALDCSQGSSYHSFKSVLAEYNVVNARNPYPHTVIDEIKRRNERVVSTLESYDQAFDTCRGCCNDINRAIVDGQPHIDYDPFWQQTVVDVIRPLFLTMINCLNAYSMDQVPA
ncbi:hypothetical protein QCA50_003798 [Cerrena zonata]|uniref:Uncharacterized protein n=1 Tax=Cerrena zonata TaxID=2478898 RepID=A0AAW0GJV0_9APHY